MITTTNKRPFFSLVLATVDREKEVSCYLESLSAQTFRDIEVIVIDQNTTDFLVPYLESFQSRTGIPVKRVVSKRGLSHARNVGLREVQGEWVAFPDDDCLYPQHFLHQVKKVIEENPYIDGLSTLVTDLQGRHSAGYMGREISRITRYNVWKSGVSCSIFFKLDAPGNIFFDEDFGVGTNWCLGSGEETDLLLRLLPLRNILYYPLIKVYHPTYHGPWKVSRAWKYGCGFGAVLRKHHYNCFVPLYYGGLQIIRCLQFAVTLEWRRSFYHLSMAAGRLCGYCIYPLRTLFSCPSSRGK